MQRFTISAEHTAIKYVSYHKFWKENTVSHRQISITEYQIPPLKTYTVRNLLSVLNSSNGNILLVYNNWGVRRIRMQPSKIKILLVTIYIS
jgi:hypothetical protein